MDAKITQIREYLMGRNKSASEGGSSTADPQIGFKLLFNQDRKKLVVKVIGVKGLPSSFGNFKLSGYSIKITSFPDKEKYETKCFRENWTTINEEFTFNVTTTNLHHFLKGRFISLTVYALAETPESSQKPKNLKPLQRIFSLTEIDFIRKRDSSRTTNRISNRHSMENRRTLGVVTYNPSLESFSQTLFDQSISTPEIWRGIKQINSGISTQPREGLKGNVEVILQYSLSEDGNNDVIEVSIVKFRCNLQTMQEHEKLGGHFYIKITASQSNDIIQKMKSDQFDATISLKIEENSATLRATVVQHQLDTMSILIRLINKSLLGKKTLLGRILIDRHSDIWKKIIENPSTPLTRVINFE